MEREFYTLHLLTLIGYLYEQDEENPWQYPNEESCDNIPSLLFKQFQESGYSTMFNEDSATGGTFQFRMNGFIEPPTDWYPRPFWIAAHEMYDGCGKLPCICETQEMLKMLKTYTRKCEDVAKFSFTMLNQAHDDMNLLFMIEDEIIGEYKLFLLLFHFLIVKFNWTRVW